MRVIILGGGVIGVSTAYYLAKNGATVTIVDRQSEVAQETSFANAGEISPGFSSPWGSPGLLPKLLKWLILQGKNSPVKWSGGLGFEQFCWLRQLWNNCNPQSYAINKIRMLELAHYSLDCFQQLITNTSIEFEHRSLGTLQLFRTQSQLQKIDQDIDILSRLNISHQLLIGKDRVANIEPALGRSSTPIAGGLHLPLDQTGDCYLFCRNLAKICQTLGVSFLFNASIDRILKVHNKISGVQLFDGRVLEADVYVVACGSYSRALLLPHEISLPVHPIKGYSLTLPIEMEINAPNSTVIDDHYKVAVTRFDQRVRIGGTAELAGYNSQPNSSRKHVLCKVVNELFPVATSKTISQSKLWSGLRPMTPDGPPIIGKTKIENLFTNTGHGTLGWTMSCGSGKYLADLLVGKPLDLDLKGLDVSRFN
ncbi:MAG: D-amino acid dehydrogenase [Gammaproteobacteria bacterium]|nr:D-amino acid dehydrogenase [Gammaproteobacteria bacterium]